MRSEVLDVRQWAGLEFRAAELGDVRRTRHLVRLAEEIALAPGRSLPEAAGGWADLKAAYRLVDSDSVSFERVIDPRWRRTRAACLSRGEFLIVEDTTAVSFDKREATEGLGPLGEGGGRGLWLHSALAPRIERSQLRTRERLEALPGILAVVAVRLVNMKLLCATRPDEKHAAETLPRQALVILEGHFGRPADGWSNRTLLVAVARLGGFLARKGDGTPGWITIRRGRRSLMLMLDGRETLAS